MEDGLKKLLSDYRRESRSFPIRWWIVTAVELMIYIFTGVFQKEDFRRVIAVAFTAGFVITSAYVTIYVFVIAPNSIKKQLYALSDCEKILEEYSKAPIIGKRRFLEEYLIFFYNMKMFLVKYSEIKSAELKGYKLLLDTGGRKPLKMPFDVDENPAILVAAMRSRNPYISVILGGKLIEKMEKMENNKK